MRFDDDISANNNNRNVRNDRNAFINNSKNTQNNSSKDNEIIDLKYKLNEANKTIENQKLRISDLENRLYNNNMIMNNYQNIINQKNIEINNLMTQLNNSNLNLVNNINPNDMMCVNFKSQDQKVHFAVPCTKNTVFAEVEEKLYKQYPELRETNNNFLANGNQVLRFKTIAENNIGFGLPVIINVPF